MSENDGFDDIVGGEEEDTEIPEFDHIMEVVEFYYRKLNPGHIFVKGVVMVESVAPEGRGNSLESSSPITDADILGMLEWGKAKMVADINAQGWVDYMEELDKRMEDKASDEDDDDE